MKQCILLTAILASLPAGAVCAADAQPGCATIPRGRESTTSVGAASEPRNDSASRGDYEARTIGGWTVHVSEELLDNHAEKTARALELLERQLEEIVRVVPEAALVELRKVALWVSPEYPGVGPKAEYHPSGGWLRKHGRKPEMARCVEFTNVRIFEAETRRMPNFALHELAHAYHHRVLGYDSPRIVAAFERMKETDKYEKVEQRFGDGRSAEVRAYARTNPQEYFAETTESFFSQNDFYPFTRQQLKEYDPEMFELLRELWGVAEGIVGAGGEAANGK